MDVSIVIPETDEDTTVNKTNGTVNKSDGNSSVLNTTTVACDMKVDVGSAGVVVIAVISNILMHFFL
jgi:hypothetical protein